MTHGMVYTKFSIKKDGSEITEKFARTTQKHTAHNKHTQSHTYTQTPTHNIYIYLYGLYNY